MMTDSDYRQVLNWLDSALEVFMSYRGKMSVKEVRVRSLLAVLRQELAEEHLKVKEMRGAK